MIIVFLFLAYLIIFVAHFLVWRAFSRFFAFSESLNRKSAYVFLALSFSFILTSLWIHYQSNILARAFYFLAGVWHGVLLQLLLASLFLYFCLLVSKVFSLTIDFRPWAIAAYALAIVVSIMGVLNVYFPMTREVVVAGSWPAEWQEKKVVLITDVHLGEVFGPAFLDRLADRIERLDPDLIFISGDLFDGMDGGFEHLQPGLARLKVKQGTYFVTGNHETYTDNLHLESIFRGTGIRHLDDELVEVDGVQILGIGYPSFGVQKKVKETILSLPGYEAAKKSVLLFHIPEGLAAVKEAGVDLMLAGHTHRGQLWPFNYITNAMFKGADHGLWQDGDFQVYTSSGVGLWGPTMRTSSRGEIVLLKFSI